MKPRFGLLVLYVSCGLLLMPGAILAQEQTGAIQGTVTDATGGVLRGATIEAHSHGSGGVTRAVTNERGVYRFPALPPAYYTLTGRADGFTPATVENVFLTLGQLLTVNLTLSVGPVADRTQVTSESPLIDVRQSASYATIDLSILDRLVIGRDFTTVIAIAPGARAEAKAGGEAQIDGASGSENRFIIDGMDTTNLQSGLSGKTLLIDFVQEVQVKSSGYAAEFGGAIGGVVSAITKSGSNQVRGSASVYYQNDHFYGARRPTHGYNPWSAGVSEGLETVSNCGTLSRPCSTGVPLIPFRTPWVYQSPVASLGGPILKDKLWYFAGFAYTKNAYREDATFVTDPTYTKRRFDWQRWAYYPTVNLTARLSDQIRVRVSVLDQRTGNRGTAPAMQPQGRTYLGSDKNLYAKDMDGFTTATFDKNADGTINQAAFDRRWSKYGTDSRTDVVAATLDWVVTPTLFVNATAGYYYANDWTSPDMRGNQIVRVIGSLMSDAWMTGRGYPTIPAAYQQPSGFTDNISSNGTLRNIYERIYANASTTWYASFGGQHQWKAGVRFERFGSDVYGGNTAPRINLYWGTPYEASDGRLLTGKYGHYVVSKTGTVGKAYSNNVSLWIQDAWSIGPKLTINAGVRAETEVIPSYKKAPDAIDIRFGFGDKIAPRLGFAYDIRGNGQSKLYGSFGYFYDITKLELPRGGFGTGHWINYAWSLDTYDWASIACDEGTSGCPGTLLEYVDMRRSGNQPDPVIAAHFNRPGMTGIDPNIKPMKAGEFTLGVDHALTPSTSIGVRYVHKWLVRTIEDVGIHVPGFGEIYLIANPGFGYTEIMEPDWPAFRTPKATRDYDALELRLWKRLSRGLSGQFNYTYSRLWGNYGGLASSDENGRVSPNVNRYFDAPYMSYDRNNKVVMGLLPTDRPHVLNIAGGYDFPWGTSIGLGAVVESGLAETTAFLYQGYPVYVNGRNDLGRLPVFSQVDLQVRHEFKLGRNRRFTLQAQVSNLFDQKAVIGYYSTYPYRSGVTFGDDSLFFGGPWDPDQLVALRRAQGALIYDQVWFKTPNAYQAPREVRLAIRFAF